MSAPCVWVRNDDVFIGFADEYTRAVAAYQGDTFSRPFLLTIERGEPVLVEMTEVTT